MTFEKQLDEAISTAHRILTAEALRRNIDFDYVGHRATALEEMQYVNVQNLLIVDELLQTTAPQVAS